VEDSGDSLEQGEDVTARTPMLKLMGGDDMLSLRNF